MKEYYFIFLLFFCIVLPGTGFSQTTDPALKRYINNHDTTFNWRDYQVKSTAEGSFYEVNLVSQKWQNIRWSHKLMAYIPAKAAYANHLLLVSMHLYDRGEGLRSLKVISDSTGTSSAILYDIPNQPLFDGKEEDELQAYTFSQYIKTGDESWPLLFPMVKGVIRAMDAIQLIAKKETGTDIDKFVVAGHSKRGHTSWLAAAVDTRVKGIIPMAIDVLNSTAQLSHHLEVFGAYSTPAEAATDLLPAWELPRGKSLINMIDPYAYRSRLHVPKLIVAATNDPFFPTDALNLYWDGLPGPKHILYLSNATHVSAYSDGRINNTAFAFVRAIASARSLPVIRFNQRKLRNGINLTITTDQGALNAVLWKSTSETKDFRKSLWTSSVMHVKGSTENVSNPPSKEFEITIQSTGKGYSMIYGELQFPDGNSKFLLTTQMFLYNGE